MNPFTNVLLDLPELGRIADVAVRLAAAAVLGGALGAERELVGKAAGLRTHMLVALGAAMFVVIPSETGVTSADISRVIQGVATGIGFIGAGTILKLRDREEIIGLTTAANLWLTAAIGVGVGMGHLWLPLIGVVIAWVVLVLLTRVEKRIQAKRRADDMADESR